jgi:predicted short-subunit dehydrogenase-like oxidoreductase (DUF2520 family)
MNIVIIGTGNVATHLGKALLESGHQISEVAGRNPQRTSELAQQLNAVAIHSFSNIATNAQVYILAVKDDALPSVAKQLPLVNGIISHTAGSLSLSILSKFINHGVIYPLQTLSRDKELNFNQVPLCIEGNNDGSEAILTELAKSISSIVSRVDSNQRLQLHLAAVFACNFVNHLYAISDKLLTDKQLNLKMLYPLIDETCTKIKCMSPYDAQTGPALRNDQTIISHHIEMLKNEPDLSHIYQTLTESIQNWHRTT